jgi:hypothetical protein
MRRFSKSAKSAAPETAFMVDGAPSAQNGRTSTERSGIAESIGISRGKSSARSIA